MARFYNQNTLPYRHNTRAIFSYNSSYSWKKLCLRRINL